MNKYKEACEKLLELHKNCNQHWVKSNKSDYALEETKLKLSKGVYEILVKLYPKEMGVKNK